jgi:hypothetical protein
MCFKYIIHYTQHRKSCVELLTEISRSTLRHRLCFDCRVRSLYHHHRIIMETQSGMITGRQKGDGPRCSDNCLHENWL